MKRHILKRPLSSELDFMALPSQPGPRTTVGFITYPIYIEELATYCAVVWDMDEDQPKVLLLNHSIFPAIRRWIFDFHNLIGTSFTVIATLNGTVITHKVFPGGGYMLTDDKMLEAKQYVEDLFEVIEETVSEDLEEPI